MSRTLPLLAAALIAPAFASAQKYAIEPGVLRVELSIDQRGHDGRSHSQRCALVSFLQPRGEGQNLRYGDLRLPKNDEVHSHQCFEQWREAYGVIAEGNHATQLSETAIKLADQIALLRACHAEVELSLNQVKVHLTDHDAFAQARLASQRGADPIESLRQIRPELLDPDAGRAAPSQEECQELERTRPSQIVENERLMGRLRHCQTREGRALFMVAKWIPQLRRWIEEATPERKLELEATLLRYSAARLKVDDELASRHQWCSEAKAAGRPLYVNCQSAAVASNAAASKKKSTN